MQAMAEFLTMKNTVKHWAGYQSRAIKGSCKTKTTLHIQRNEKYLANK